MRIHPPPRGKNSDRPAGEPQSVRRYPAASHSAGELKCTYIRIPQVERTRAVLLSQIDWMWGAEMGANDAGVVVGNEAVWTNVPDDGDEALLGMDLVRLGLERGSTSREALDVVVDLLETHGQGGACAENDPSFTYHNSFLIADANECWILETAGTHWAAKRMSQGCINISNGLSIRTDFDLCSYDLKEYATEKGWWDGKGEMDFAKCFGSGPVDAEVEGTRQFCGAALLGEHDDGKLDAEAMKEILRDHKGGICMHGAFETTSAMVSELRRETDSDRQVKARHWMTGKPYPCQSEFCQVNLLSRN